MNLYRLLCMVYSVRNSKEFACLFSSLVSRLVSQLVGWNFCNAPKYLILTKARQQPQNIVEIQKNWIVSSLRKKGQYKNFCNDPKYSF